MSSDEIKNLTFLWCIPRSLSTAFEKMMACSNQFQVIGEPFIDTYKKSKLSNDDFKYANREFSGICENLLCASITQAVFVKDMGYHALPFITDEIICSINNTFLIRDPRLSIPSLYKMRPEYTEDHTGFEGQYQLFLKVCDALGEPPLVIDGERLKTHASDIVPDYFKYIKQDLPQGIFT